MPMLEVPANYPTIRAAIQAAQTDDQISIAAGTYDIRDLYAIGDLLGPATFAYTTDLNCLTGFTTTTGLMYSGDVTSLPYDPLTKITGNARLYVANQDSQAPISISFDNLEFIYTNASFNYILQTGQFNLDESQTITDNIQFTNVKFSGSHAGSPGANGNYMTVLGIESFGLNDSIVQLTGQTSFTGTQSQTGGSSFLMLQGGNPDGSSLVINMTKFDESGYRNGVSIFNSKNLTISNDTFYRSDATTRYSRSRDVGGVQRFNVGNKLSNTDATITSNNFYDGSYLVLERTTGNSSNVALTGSHFHQWDDSVSPSPSPILGGGAVAIALEGNNVASYTSFGGNLFDYVNPINNYTSSVVTIASGGSQVTNPSTNSRVTMATFRAGGTANDTITGTNNSNEWFNGGSGNDIINTGSGASNPDFVFFNTPLNATTNVDTITNLNFAATNNADRIMLDRKYFSGITAHFNSGAGIVGGVGAVSASNIENNTTGTATNASTRLVYNTSNGSLFYDPTGSSVAGDEVLFAKLYSSAAATTAASPLIGFTGANANLVNISVF